MMQGLELPAPPLLAATELPPAHDLPLCPPTPPGTAHKFPEPQDTTGQARRRANTGLSTRKGPQVLCKILSVSAPTTTLITSSTVSLTTTAATTFTINSPTVLSALTPSASSANMMVNDS